MVAAGERSPDEALDHEEVVQALRGLSPGLRTTARLVRDLRAADRIGHLGSDLGTIAALVRWLPFGVDGPDISGETSPDGARVHFHAAWREDQLIQSISHARNTEA